MAFLRSSTRPEVPSLLQGSRVWLRQPQIGDYVAWAELRAMSRDHLVPWEPLWPRDDLTRSGYRRRVRHYQREAREDQGYAFSIFQSGDDRLIGGVTLSNLRRGITQAATLGYWLGRPYTGQGLMTDAVKSIIEFSFDTLRLHRLDAAAMPVNAPSIRVLERAGFEHEGFAKSYLKISGAWEDHVLYGLVAPSVGGRSA